MKKYPHLEVRMSKIHHRGVFAARDIKKRERIIEYTGRRLTFAESERSNSEYLFQLNRNTFIDGKNTARYINHSCVPNCFIEIERGHIWIDALRKIKKGEELVYNYSFDMEEAKDYPCACGTNVCPGYIVDETYWPKLRKQMKKKQKK